MRDIKMKKVTNPTHSFSNDVLIINNVLGRVKNANRTYSRAIVLCQSLGPKSRRKINIDQLSTLLADINVWGNYVGYDSALYEKLTKFETLYYFIDEMFEKLRNYT